MSKRKLLGLASLLLLFSLVLLGAILYPSFSPSKCSNCNLIIISIDTLRPDHMGTYGYDKDTTPNIDSWAKNAIKFTNFKTIAPVTFPSLYALMTGIDPLEAGIFNNKPTDFSIKELKSKYKPFDSNHPTLAMTLKKNGYKTSAFITNSALDPNATQIKTGFDSFEFLESDPYATISNKSEYSAFIQKTLPWLSRNQNEKFFLWIHLINPHAPYSPVNDSICKIDKTLCKELSDKSLLDLELERKSWEGCKDITVPQETLARFQKLYDSEIVFDDQLVGEILKKIGSLKLDKNTVVMLYGDHGEGFDHKYYFHHSHVLYDTATHIPLIVKLPGKKGSLNKQLFDNTDIFHSLLNVLSVDTTNPKNNIFQKHSFLDKGKQYVFSSSADLTKYSIQDDTYKYIYSLPERACLFNNQTEELYNLSEDQMETVNLLKEKGDIASKLKKELFTHFSTYGLPKIVKQDPSEAIDKEKQKIIDTLKNIGY